MTLRNVLCGVFGNALVVKRSSSTSWKTNVITARCIHTGPITCTKKISDWLRTPAVGSVRWQNTYQVSTMPQTYGKEMNPANEQIARTLITSADRELQGTGSRFRSFPPRLTLHKCRFRLHSTSAKPEARDDYIPTIFLIVFAVRIVNLLPIFALAVFDHQFVF